MRIGIVGAVAGMVKQIEAELPGCAFQASNELRNASLEVLRGQRSGRRYNTPGSGRVKYYKRTKTAKITYRQYSASAPGEPPAVRTGTLRSSFRPVQNGNIPTLESDVPYAEYMDQGTPGGMIAPRPYAEKTIEKALPKIKRIYRDALGAKPK